MNAVILFDVKTNKYDICDHNLLDVAAKTMVLELRKAKLPAFILEQVTFHSDEPTECKDCRRAVWRITCNNVTRRTYARSHQSRK